LELNWMEFFGSFIVKIHFFQPCTPVYLF
jgi:hypothetical protein